MPLSALADGDVDIVMSQTSTEKSSTMWVSDPYIETGVALFASNGSTTVPESVQASSIAAQSSSRAPGLFKTLSAMMR